MQKPIKSRSGLTRCPSCRAHVHAAARPSETVCPFCGAIVGSGAARVVRAAGRGGVLAASLLALSACNGSAETSSPEQNTNQPVVEPGSGGSESTDAEDEYEREADDPVAVEAYGVAPSEPPPEPPPVPAYGVAPPRRP